MEESRWRARREKAILACALYLASFAVVVVCLNQQEVVALMNDEIPTGSGLLSAAESAIGDVSGGVEVVKYEERGRENKSRCRGLVVRWEKFILWAMVVGKAATAWHIPLAHLKQHPNHARQSQEKKFAYFATTIYWDESLLSSAMRLGKPPFGSFRRMRNLWIPT